LKAVGTVRPLGILLRTVIGAHGRKRLSLFVVMEISPLGVRCRGREKEKMGEIRFTIDGPPVGKERPRTGRGGHFYTPSRTKNYEAHVWMALWMSHNLSKVVPLIQKAEKVNIIATFYFKNKRHPDLDNCVKALWDGLQGEGRLGNDNRFVGGMNLGYDKDNPRTEVTVTW